MEKFEYVTIRENLSDICDCISEADLVRFSMELLQHDIISDASHQAAIAVSGSAPADKIAHLVTEVMKKVKFSPEYFHKFLSILESRSKKLYQALRKRYFELQGCAPDEPTSVILISPSKPHVSPVSYGSIQITWQKPDYDGDILIKYYRISYRAMSDPDDKWSALMTEDDKSSYVFPAGPGIAYVFTVSAITTAGHSSESEVSDSIEVKPRPWGTRMLHKCELIKEESEYNASIHQLPLRYTMKRENIAKVTVGESAAVRSRGVVPHKVLMVVGATGAGKSTLIDAMANYIMGVDWEDSFRFRLISEETARDQSKSQTKRITAYTFHKDGSSPLPYTLTVIDTPGFGDIDGIQNDKKILRQIKEFFSTQSDEGIDQLHGIGFVAQANLARLTQTQRCVFDSILSPFGKDVADNIFLMLTFADGERPPVLDAVRRRCDVPFSNHVHFKFNNSAFFASNRASEYSKMLWKISKQSFEDFFNDLSRAPTQSFQQSKAVLQQREQLETTVQSLQPWFHAGRFQNVDQDVIQLIEQARQSLRCLQQIALKPDYLTDVDDISFLIESERHERRDGWRERVKTLEELEKQAKIVSTLAKHGQKF